MTCSPAAASLKVFLADDSAAIRERVNALLDLKAVRTADPAVAFVVFSNNAAPAYRKRYLGEGALRFLDKSTEFDQLAAAVAAAARRPVH